MGADTFNKAQKRELVKLFTSSIFRCGNQTKSTFIFELGAASVAAVCDRRFDTPTSTVMDRRYSEPIVTS
jgi:hypothetical protein